MQSMTGAAGQPRSWRVHRLGPPGHALRLGSTAALRPGPGQARVKVEAIGLNHPDILLCEGRYQERPTLPFSPGYEAAGVVVEVGAGSVLRMGQHVIVVPELPNGAMQEYLTVPDEQVYPVPDSMPWRTAAVLHIAYVTAHAALHRRGRLRAGESVLVSGGAGGVGSAVIQLAKVAGAQVIALASGEVKARACTDLGADVVIDVAVDHDVAAQVRAATNGRGADVAIDVVGGDMFDGLRRSLAFEARIVTVGFTGGTVPSVPVNHVLLRNYSLVGLNLAAYRRADPAMLRGAHAELVSLEQSGAISPVIHRELPFDQAPAGLLLLAERSVVGRVVLRC
jgi:NADPH2:quinone reductase